VLAASFAFCVLAVAAVPVVAAGAACAILPATTAVAACAVSTHARVMSVV